MSTEWNAEDMILIQNTVFATAVAMNTMMMDGTRLPAHTTAGTAIMSRMSRLYTKTEPDTGGAIGKRLPVCIESDFL